MTAATWSAHLRRFRPRLLDDLAHYDRRRFAADLGAGLTVGIVALPLAMAFAIASGVKPEQGIFTAIIAGFLISALGGSSVQIGGPAGAFIVIVYGIVQRYGFANLLIATMLAGVLLFILGWLRLGALVRIIPVSIVIGFTNGIAVLIALSQVKDLLGLQFGQTSADFFSQVQAIGAHARDVNPHALALGAACFFGLILWSRLARPAEPRAAPDSSGAAGHGLRSAWEALRWIVRHIPGPIVALVTLTLLAAMLKLPVETVGSRFGSIPQALPAFAWPAFDWASARDLVAPTLTIALLGAVESLLCARVADRVSTLQPHDSSQELMAQGIANVVAPLFGGIPATGTIARTMTNVRAGATSPVAGIVHAATLLAIILTAAPLAGHIPLAVFAGVLLFVALNMGEWHEFSRLGQYAMEHRVKVIATFVLTVAVDLTVAMEVGLATACVVFVYRMSALFSVERAEDAATAPRSVVFALHGPLFFAGAGKIESITEQTPPGASRVVLDATDLLSIDSSGLSALANLRQVLARSAIELVLVHPNDRCRSAIRRAGLEPLLGEPPGS